MSSYESDTGLASELEPIKLPLRGTIFLKGLRLLEILHQRKRNSQASREAKEYERKAQQHAGTEPVELGKLLVSAGRAYLNARKPDAAVASLEAARPHLETYKMSGTFDGFSALAGLYQSLGYAYARAGQEDESKEVRAKAVDLADSMEEHFGIHTEFLPSGGCVLSSVDRQAA